MSGLTLAMTGGNSIPQLGFSVYQATDGLEVSADVHALTHVSQKHHTSRIEVNSGLMLNCPRPTWRKSMPRSANSDLILTRRRLTSDSRRFCIVWLKCRFAGA